MLYRANTSFGEWLIEIHIQSNGVSTGSIRGRMDQRAYGVEVPCCTDRLSLMAGTYGNGSPSLVPSGTAWLANRPWVVYLRQQEIRLVARCERLRVSLYL